MDQTSNYGLLINQNTKLQRKQFIEMTKLLGIKVKYRYPLRNQNYTNNGELFSSYSTPIDVGCILNDHPDIKTTKKLGWNSELVDGAMVISLPYELENLQVGCLVELPSGFDNTPSRLFRITKMSTIMVYPASISCEIVPEYPDIVEKAEISMFKDSNFNLLNEE